MTNPTYSVFTVTVDFRGTFYDVEITPTLNDKPIEWLQDRVDQWVAAETTHKLFSQKIVEMLNHTNLPEDYSLAKHGVITTGSVEGFTFDKGLEITHTTREVWEEFIDCLQDPASQIAGLDPVDEDDEVIGTELGARIKSTPNDYLNLGKEAKKAVRLSLFEKRSCELFDLPFVAYKPEELFCFAHLFQLGEVRLPTKDKEQISRELMAWFFHKHLLLAREDKDLSERELLQIEEERREMSRVFKEQVLKSQQAAEALQVENDSDSESTTLYLSESEEL